MAAGITIDKTDLTELNLTLSRLKNESPKAIVGATNDAMKGINTQAVKEIGAKVTLKAALIKQHFEINKMKITDLSADITCKGEPVPLIFYSVNQTAKGLTVKVKEKGSRKLVKHAFKVKFKSGHKEAVWREDRFPGKRLKRWPVGKKAKAPPSPDKRSGEMIKNRTSTFQLPLNVLYGPRVPDVFDDPDIIDPVLANAKIRFQERLEHHTQRMIDMAR